MQVNNDTTSKDTRMFSLGMVCDLIKSTKALDFLMWEPVKPQLGRADLLETWRAHM